MGSMKRSLFVLSAVVLGAVLLMATRNDEPTAPGASEITGEQARPPAEDPPGATFQVRLKKPRMARPLFGLLPTAVERALEDHGRLRFDEKSPGAWVGGVGEDGLALGAEGWDLLIEATEDGAIAEGTRLVISLILAEKPRTLRCRPADPAVGFLRATPRDGSGELDGELMVKLATCENTETGKVIEWPPAPLTLRGSFSGLVSGPGPTASPTAF